MISKKYIKDLEFNDLNEFFNYVLESKINGNYSQTKEFIKKMNNKQFKDFLLFLKEYSQENLNEEFIYMRLNL